MNGLSEWVSICLAQQFFIHDTGYTYCFKLSFVSQIRAQDLHYLAGYMDLLRDTNAK